MDFRYHIDPETDLPHIHGHGVTEEEAEYILRHPGGGSSRSRRLSARAGPDHFRALSACRLRPRRGR